MKYAFVIVCLYIVSCTSPKYIQVIKKDSKPVTTGSSFYTTVAGYNWQQRDSLAKEIILKEGLPPFLRRFVRIHAATTASDGKMVNAFYYVSPDYLSIGTNDDFARIPLTPMTAQVIADSLRCFLPTKKMVNDIYEQAVVKLQPIPMYAFRDSSPTFWQHHLMIEGQRKGRKGLIAGIKKDVVITSAISKSNRPNRVAIYGWHKLDGKPIQPLYTGHVNWYVDYSHGVRLVYRIIWVDGKAMDYIDVLKDPLLKGLLCDEEECTMYRY